MDERNQRVAALRELLAEHIVVLDGAMGTALQAAQLGPDDFGGPELEGCNEMLTQTRPDVVRDIHLKYLRAGAHVVETNTFGGTPLVLAEYGIAHLTRQLNRQAAILAREACDEVGSFSRPRFVAGSMGPTTRAISVTGGVTFEELITHYQTQALGLMEGGVDYLFLETAQDTRNLKAGLLGIERATAELGFTVPIAVSGTIEPMGTMLAGQGVEALFASLAHHDLLYLGLNCATGPEFMTDHIRSLAALANFPVSCIPNAGLPDENGHYLESPAMIARTLRRFAEVGWLNVVGGCCGTHEGHIAAIAQAVKDLSPRRIKVHPRFLVSGIEPLEISDQNRPVLVGERTNVIGSRLFKRLITDGQFEEASEIARRQVKAGAQIIDVCLANPDRDELADTDRFFSQVIHKVKVPLMIDSTDGVVIERALTWCQGRALINSINLEDGEERFERVVPLARRYGAALVVGCIDEDPVQGMAVSRTRKVEIARRSFELLTTRYCIRPQDIVFDPLVFPCATGDENYVGSAAETIEGIRLIKAEFPEVRTILGISNVSFGLPAAGREVLNAVFLYHCVQAGLDLAIVNTEKLERYASLSEEDRHLAENLLFNRGEDPIAAFAAAFRTRVARTVAASDLPLDTRLARYVVEGSRDGLVPDLELKLQELGALEIINGPLMAGMDEVGRLFNDNKMIVAEVLQSAEVMKAAVDYLQPHLPKAGGPRQGRLLLATVKGDVHDIGKNLVDIILSNNGFEVINLGIKVEPARLIAAVKEYQPDMIGLSGLLVKSAHQMVVTAEDLRTAGIHIPLLVGGAALTRRFSELRIAGAYAGPVLYARDAMEGLDLARRARKPEALAQLKTAVEERQAQWREEADGARSPSVEGNLPRSQVEVLDTLPLPPDLDRHTLRGVPLPEIWQYLNLQMLYGRHLGFRGSVRRALDEHDPQIMALKEEVEAVQVRCQQEGLMEVQMVWRFFEATPLGDALLLRAGDAEGITFHFPRQGTTPHLCLADYVAPPLPGKQDHVALFVVTAGKGIRAVAERWKEEGQLLRCHILQALALESAEAAAEWLHRKLRSAWGFPDGLDLTMEERLRAHYRGKRYSFGYPACPELADQAKLFALLRPEDVGVELTDGFMMEPEASVSAMVFHHPLARYFQG